MFDYLDPLCAKHWYTLAATGIKFKSREFSSRQVAEEEMHKFLNKNHLKIKEVWDDNHYKTYVCNYGIKFYINRI